MRATPEPKKHVAKQSSWFLILLGALSGLVCVPIQCAQRLKYSAAGTSLKVGGGKDKEFSSLGITTFHLYSQA